MSHSKSLGLTNRVPKAMRQMKALPPDRPPFGKRKDLVTGHDEMVDDRDIDEVLRRFEDLRHHLVDPRRLGIAGWLVVGHGDNRGVAGKSACERSG